MKSDFPCSGDDTMLKALISGWAKSRGGNDVSVLHEEGHTHCVFTVPVGKLFRDRESFYWRSPDAVASATAFHGSRHHFLSIFGNEVKSGDTLTCAGYRLLSRETLMYKPVEGSGHNKETLVRRVQTEHEANWYNLQKGKIFIRPEHLSDPDVYDFYTCQDGIMTAHTRALRHGDYFIVDDMQTHPHFRRRGLASGLLAEITRTASRAGAGRLVLIASEAGVPLYLRDNYISLAPLRVYISPHQTNL